MEIIFPGRLGIFLNIAFGYTLILLTIWSTRPVQKKLFWIDVAFFLSMAVLALYRRPTAEDCNPCNQSFGGDAALSGSSMALDGNRPQSSCAFVRFIRRRFRRPVLGLPPFHFSIIVIAMGLLAALVVVAVSDRLGTLHRLFGQPNALLHGTSYLLWAVVQQWIQQSFFFVRMERIIHRGILASFTTAALFGLAHLPNPVLAPLTFIGGWFLSELYRRYRTLVPLGIAHGLVGLAIALSVPDRLNHHMRVGLGYLHYMS
ncbi:MAG TPA: CPBP family intramembrane glutamic endopeptidase [Candidatus Angelobacter sp.]|nr:CPBP family intramembrane glutamic endopeptidase [Candidatus Angelobacter sp.]